MPSINGSFRVTDGADVELMVDIGDGQLGRSSAAIRGTEIAAGETIRERIGRGEDLRGEVLFVVSAVKDIRPETNHASATVFLRCAGEEREFVQRDRVKQDGGTIVFTFAIAFK